MCYTVGLVLSLQREILPSTRLGTLPPAFSTRVLPAQATEYAFAFIQVPQDVSLPPSKADCPLSNCHSLSRLAGKDGNSEEFLVIELRRWG